MHVPDHVMDPSTGIAMTAIAVAGVGYAAYRVYHEFPRQKVPLLSVVAACVFAAQMFNFPVGIEVSGHWVGAVLAAVILGPWAGMLAITAVLVVQCLLFQDGGITALGANVVNMGMVGSLVGYAIYDRLRKRFDGKAGSLFAAAVASWVAVTIGAGVCSLQLSTSGDFPLVPTVTAMVLAHSVIGIGEAAITVAAMSALWSWRSAALLGNHQSPAPAIRVSHAVAGLGLAAILVVVATPFASPWPDGLEATLTALGHHESPAILAAPMPDYQWPGMASIALLNIVPGLVGVAAVFASAMVVPARR